MDLDHGGRVEPGGLMQAVDVLRDDAGEPARLGQRGERAMRGRRRRALDMREESLLLAPVAIAHVGRREKMVERHASRACPQPGRSAEIGQARGRADARARQHADARRCVHELAQRAAREVAGARALGPPD